jgi:cytochrome c-type protein NapB
MKKLLISSVLAALFASSLMATDTVKVTGIRDAGLNQGSQNLPEIKYNSAMPIPGQVQNIPKSYVTAPPMIPHKISNMVPITIHDNECLSCHMPRTAKALGIKAIPKDHFVNNFANSNFSTSNKNNTKYKFVKQQRLAGSRFNCTQCHAPQAQLDPAIENRFEQIRTERP